MKKLTLKKPAFKQYEMAQLTRYIPPLLSGSLVRIQAIQPYQDGCRYQVQTIEYAAEPAWVYEDDLAWIIMGSG